MFDRPHCARIWTKLTYCHSADSRRCSWIGRVSRAVANCRVVTPTKWIWVDADHEYYAVCFCKRKKSKIESSGSLWHFPFSISYCSAWTTLLPNIRFISYEGFRFLCWTVSRECNTVAFCGVADFTGNMVDCPNNLSTSRTVRDISSICVAKTNQRLFFLANKSLPRRRQRNSHPHCPRCFDDLCVCHSSSCVSFSSFLLQWDEGSPLTYAPFHYRLLWLHFPTMIVRWAANTRNSNFNHFHLKQYPT